MLNKEQLEALDDISEELNYSDETTISDAFDTFVKNIPDKLLQTLCSEHIDSDEALTIVMKDESWQYSLTQNITLPDLCAVIYETVSPNTTPFNHGREQELAKLLSELYPDEAKAIYNELEYWVQPIDK